MVTLQQMHRWLREQMPSPFEAEQLFFHVTGYRAYDLPGVGGEPVAEEQRALLEQLCQRRQSGEPLQYVLGEWEFYGLPFVVGEGVLIPRADTETLVEAALDIAKTTDAPRIVDLCSGSGAVAVALAHSMPQAAVWAVEISGKALPYLRQNCKKNRVDINIAQADALCWQPPVPVDLITANPPYIPSGDIAGLQVEVGYEPALALDGGEDGLDFYRALSRHCRSYLKEGGALCFEVGIHQAEEVAAIMARDGYKEINTLRDLGGVARVVTGKG